MQWIGSLTCLTWRLCRQAPIYASHLLEREEGYCCCELSPRLHGIDCETGMRWDKLGLNINSSMEGLQHLSNHIANLTGYAKLRAELFKMVRCRLLYLKESQLIGKGNSRKLVHLLANVLENLEPTGADNQWQGAEQAGVRQRPCLCSRAAASWHGDYRLFCPSDSLFPRSSASGEWRWGEEVNSKYNIFVCKFPHCQMREEQRELDTFAVSLQCHCRRACIRSL